MPIQIRPIRFSANDFMTQPLALEAGHNVSQPFRGVGEPALRKPQEPTRRTP